MSHCALLLKKNEAALMYFEAGVAVYNTKKTRVVRRSSDKGDITVDSMLNCTLLYELFSSLGDTYQN